MLVLEGLVQNQGVDENGEHKQRSDDRPADAVVQRSLDANHELHVTAESLHTVDPGNGHQLEDGQHQGHERDSKVVDQVEQELATGCDVQKAQKVAYNGYTNHHSPVLQVSELILDHGGHAGGHAHIAADAQDEEHEEEQHGE